jgi:uncharacterized membrane protein
MEGKTKWNIVGSGLALIILSALFLMFLPLSQVRVAGIIIIIIVGFALCVAGSPDSKE